MGIMNSSQSELTKGTCDMTVKTKNNNAISDYSDMIIKRIWLRIGWQIKTQGLTVRGVCVKAGIEHSVVVKNTKCARDGRVPPDAKIEIIDRICTALERPLSFFMQV